MSLTLRSLTQLPRGSVAVLFVTGEGVTDPDGMDGAIAGSPLPKPRATVSVWLEDVTSDDGSSSQAEILYAGAAPGSVAGLLQINIRVPPWARTGDAVPVSVQIGTEPLESGVSMAIK